MKKTIMVKNAEAFALLTAVNLDKGLPVLLDGPLTHRRKLGFSTTSGDIPLVSVIIRSMDRPTLDDALDSLALQTYSNIEVVLVNAKGPGHRKVEQWCGRFPMRFIDSAKPLRRSRAANMGLDTAHGEYLIFLDDDDWFDADHIQKLTAAIRQHPEFKVVYTGVRCVDEGKNPLVNKFDESFDAVQIVAGNFIPIHAVLFSRYLLEVGCRLDESMDLYEDWDFWIQLSRYGDFLHIDGLSAIYRITQQSGFGVTADPTVAERAALILHKKWVTQLNDSQITGLMYAVLHNRIKDGQISDLRHVVAERDGQISSLNQAVYDKDVHINNLDGQISSLNQAVYDKDVHINNLDGQISSFNQAVYDKDVHINNLDGQISSLNQAVYDKDVHINNLDGQIVGLSQTVAESNNRLQFLEREISERDRTVQAQADTMAELLDSSSWRVTRPLRYIGRLWRKVKAVKAVAHQLLEREPLPVLSRKLMRIFRREGLEGVKARIRQQHYLTTQAAEPSGLRSSAKMGFSLEPAAIVRDLQGHYALAPVSKGYTYIEPQRPVDIEVRLAALESAPLFSIVVPVYNTPPKLLDAAIASVQAQWYPRWHLVLVDDASSAEETRQALARINHPQIKLLSLKKNQGIASATNVAIEAAEGDFIVFMDHDDELTVDCLYELALCIEREQPDYIYSDEDKITESGEYSEPHFKPDWSPDAMMSTMFTCHVSCVRRSLLEKVGGLRSQYDGCQDWDFVLRVSEQTDRISHIPKVLYHWRIIAGSIAADIAEKSYVLEASRRVREDALLRRGLAAIVEPLPQMEGYFRIAYQLQGNPLVSIIIPTRDNEKVLRRCVNSILQLTSYRHFELVVIDNESVEPTAIAYLQQLKEQDGVTVIRHDAPFNFSELNNIGARAAAGELLLFLNDDTEVLQEDWLERLGGFAQLAHVGAVGAKLLYPGQTQIQHAGVLNLGDGPGHAFLMQDCDSHGYYMRNLLEYNWLAVTGACLMVTREKFDAIGGFCETLPVAYNDIDLCMRLYDAGFYNVVCQAVRLTHHESASRGLDNVNPEKVARLIRDLAHLYERNPGYFQYDPFHNPNLHPNGINFEVPA